MTSITTAIVTCLLSISFYLYFYPPPEVSHLPLTTKINTSYDYIIVGAGTAGSVLASRLSEDEDVTVLLLEAGPDDRGAARIYTPALAASLWHSDLDWEYYTVPQNQSHFGYVDRKSYWPRGRMLGGTSNINSMAYIRGSRRDYDTWAELGGEGWSFKDVLPYFLKSEGNQDLKDLQEEFHGKDGPQKIDTPRQSLIADLQLQAGLELGFKHIDPNGRDLGAGVVRTQATMYRGERCGTSRAYLHPALNRSNLHVLDNAHVTKVLFNKKTAVGVQYVRHGRLQEVRARREVIVSAGAIGSAQLLLLSGIGPQLHLQNLSIPTVADLPVGENLQDHLFITYQIGLQQQVAPVPDIHSLWSQLQYRLFRSGPLSSIVGPGVMIFASTDEQSRSLNWPDLQLFLLGRLFDANKLRIYGFSEESVEELRQKEAFPGGFPCLALHLRPKSRGTIRLKSKDPFDYPLIDPNYLSHDEDVDALVRGVRECQRLQTAPVFMSLGAQPADPPSPICAEHVFDSDQYWRCRVRRHAQTMYHPVGTCSMGRDPRQGRGQNQGQLNSVVDPRLSSPY